MTVCTPVKIVPTSNLGVCLTFSHEKLDNVAMNGPHICVFKKC